MLFQDQPGQCSARNVGLENATGTHILFLDDDDEIEPDLIERHLRTLQEFQADVSCGVADEDGAGPLPTHFTYLRTSDVFPTNNALLQREALCASGLFDLAYDRGRNEDGDLGMRLYLSGSHMILNPEISVIHHHAPVGGLRTHKQRTITYASSRRRLRHRTIPSVSELYQFMRYFTPEQVREMLWIEVLGTFSLRGPTWKRILKVIVALFCLPHTLWRIKNNHRQASRMMKKFPRIPSLGVYATLEEVP
jgi:glycosyltransferase involved in cell wall biosynthesis